MAGWLAALGECEASGEACVLVTVLAARGSTPREAGVKMVVAADALHGTIGGGSLEFTAVAAARAVLAEGASGPVVREFPLGPALGQCCGGFVSVLFEPMLPSDLQIALFGAGHVGRALVRVLGELPCRVRWIDARGEAFPDTIAGNATRIVSADPAAEVALLPAGSLALVMTHDHGLDFEIVAACLARDDLLGIGLIGSATKRARFVGRLRARGMDAARIARLICPIGVAGAGGKLPAEIAIAVAAQILQIRDDKMVNRQAEDRAHEGGTAGSEVVALRPPAKSCGVADCSCDAAHEVAARR